MLVNFPTKTKHMLYPFPGAVSEKRASCTLCNSILYYLDELIWEQLAQGNSPTLADATLVLEV